MSPRVLVTGSSGWLGRALARALARDGAEVRGFDLVAAPPDGESDPDAGAGDLANLEDARRACAHRPEVVYHCAGIIHPRRVSEFERVNVQAGRRLLEAAVAVGARRVVIVSSNSVCGHHPDPARPFDEDSPYAPAQGYGLSKMRLELAARGFQDRVEVVVARAPWFYGPGQSARQTRFFSMIRSGRAPVVGSGENVRSMAYVDNLVAGLRLAGTVPAAAGRTYWLADLRPYRWNEILDTVAEVLRSDFGLTVSPGRLRLPAFAAAVAGAADRAIQAVGGYQQELHVLSECDKNIACSIGRARAELGYAPAVALREGMRRSVEWCVRRGLAL